mgnify:CR=1 FL=1
MSLIEIIPCLSDNYAYLIRDEKTNKNILVDAPEHGPIETYLDKKALSLDAILITHHHNDHIDGINYLKIKYSPKVIGAKRDKHRLPPLDVEVEEGKELKIGSKTFEIYDVDGHTIGHIAYGLMEDKALFSGDSLMVMGCGRLFEGTPEDMWKSLKKLKQLPKDIMIYSGHEYTKSNIEFALSVDPQNEKLKTVLLLLLTNGTNCWAANAVCKPNSDFQGLKPSPQNYVSGEFRRLLEIWIRRGKYCWDPILKLFKIRF